MKTILTAIIFLFMASIACAEPYLVCDPTTDLITQVEIEITHSGTTTVQTGYYMDQETYVELFDLANQPNGAYTFRARWATADNWWSDWSEPIEAVKSNRPGNFRIK